MTFLECSRKNYSERAPYDMTKGIACSQIGIQYLFLVVLRTKHCKSRKSRLEIMFRIQIGMPKAITSKSRRLNHITCNCHNIRDRRYETPLNQRSQKQQNLSWGSNYTYPAISRHNKISSYFLFLLLPSLI